MKILKVITACTAAAFIMCGCVPIGYFEDRDIAESGISVSSDGFQKIEIDVQSKEKPEIIKAVLEGKCSGNISDYCTVYDAYPGNVIVSSWAGLIGSPIVVSGSSGIENSTLTLTYDDTKLSGVPEKNIRAIYVKDNGNDFTKIPDLKTDEKANTAVIPVMGDGYYILYDIYEYGKAVGENVSEYAYEKTLTDYETDWEMECDTGDIMAIADKEWAVKNAPDFYVENPVQLASAVYYANGLAKADQGPSAVINIYIMNDLDLHKFKWVPIGWRNSAYLTVNIDGKGHTIYSLNINQPDKLEVGFIGYAGGINMSDLNFEDAYVRGSKYVGLMCGECHGTMNYVNVKAQGKVFGDEVDSASFVGAGSHGVYTNCENNVAVNGSKCQYYCWADKHLAENSDESLCTLTVDENGNVHRTNDNDEKLGNIAWVIQGKENGEHILSRSAMNETVLRKELVESLTDKDYTVYLSAFYESGYVRVSNTVEVEID